MDTEESNRPAHLANDSSAGEAALLVVEMLLFRLIDREIIAADSLVAEIESLAADMAETGPRPLVSTSRGRLAMLANSLSAHPESGNRT